MKIAPITERFVAALNEKFAANNEKYSRVYKASGGRRFDRVYTENSNQRICYAFVERETGLLYKSAGWSAPAADARYDMSTDLNFRVTLAAADEHGSYLYK